MILFLDFDGVLHPSEVYLLRGRPTLKAEGELFMWAPLLEAVLADFPEVQIVLSTAWVESRGFSRARKVLPTGLRERVIGATYHSQVEPDWLHATRWRQIARYLNRIPPGPWVAIDDLHGHDPDEPWPAQHRHRLVLTDPDAGLSDPAAVATLRAALETARQGQFQDQPRRVLFLDFDGVLHGLNGSRFEKRTLLWGILRQVPDIQVVFSTSWREIYRFDQLLDFVTAGGGEDLRERFIGVTPVLDGALSQRGSRQAEIEAWLKASGEPDWLALDDMPLVFRQHCPNLVLCPVSGLDEATVAEAIRRLKGKAPW